MVCFNDFKWEGPFKVIKVLTNFNYIIRKVGTFRTQCVHRVRLRPFTPNAPIPDIKEDSNRLFADPDAVDITIHMPQKWTLSSSVKCIFRKTRTNRILVKQSSVLIVNFDAQCNQNLRILVIERN